MKQVGKLKILAVATIMAMGLSGCIGGGGGNNSDGNNSDGSSSLSNVLFSGVKTNLLFADFYDINFYKAQNLYIELDGCGSSDLVNGDTEFVVFKDGSARTSYVSGGAVVTDFCELTNIYSKETRLDSSITDLDAIYIKSEGSSYIFSSENYDATILTEYPGNEVLATQGVDKSTIRLTDITAAGNFMIGRIAWFADYNDRPPGDFEKNITVESILLRLDKDLFIN